MIEKFDPFEAFENNKEKKEEILYIEPLNIPFKQIEIPKIEKLSSNIDSFNESYTCKSIRAYKNISNTCKFITRRINLN